LAGLCDAADLVSSFIGDFTGTVIGFPFLRSYTGLLSTCLLSFTATIGFLTTIGFYYLTCDYIGLFTTGFSSLTWDCIGLFWAGLGWVTWGLMGFT